MHTSSIAAIHRRHMNQELTESDWNDWATIDNDPYGFAKTEAGERLFPFFFFFFFTYFAF